MTTAKIPIPDPSDTKIFLDLFFFTLLKAVFIAVRKLVFLGLMVFEYLFCFEIFLSFVLSVILDITPYG